MTEPSAPGGSTPDASSAVASARTARWPWRAITIGLLLASFVLLLGLWLARSAIVTALVARSLDARGVRCEALSIEASATISELEIAPTACEVAEGPITRVAWDAPMRAQLEGGGLGALEVPTLTIVRRASAEDPAAASGALGVWAQAPARVGGVVRFVSRLSEIDSPALRVAHVVVTRSDAAADAGPELELRELVAPARTAGTPAMMSIEELALATSRGPLGLSAAPRLRDVDVEADTTHGSLEGAVDATVDMPMLGALQLGALTGGARVRVCVDQLDGEPRWSVQLE